MAPFLSHILTPGMGTIQGGRSSPKCLHSAYGVVILVRFASKTKKGAYASIDANPFTYCLFWCPRLDSNQHGLATTTPST